MRRFLLPLLVLLSCFAANAQTPAAEPAAMHERASPGDELKISLLTFAPGETYWQRFGHNAILVENTVTGANAVYNYGMFDFFQKNFFLNFARGHMQYWLAVDSLERTLQVYAYEGRWVHQQVLDLDGRRRLELARFLDRNAQPAQREYRYDYFRDNCSIRVRDALDRVLGGALATTLKSQAVPVTYRFEGTRLIRPIVPLALGMDFIMGPAGDAPISRWEQSFVPEVLMQAVAEQKIDGRPLVLETHELLPNQASPAAPAEPLRWSSAALAAGLLLGLMLAALGQLHRRLPFALLASPVLLVSGLAGVFMLAAWLLTDHWAMAANHNLLLCSPLAFLLLPTAWRRLRVPGLAPQGRWRLVLAWLLPIGAGLSLLGGQQNATWVMLWLPINAGLAYGLLRRV